MSAVPWQEMSPGPERTRAKRRAFIEAWGGDADADDVEQALDDDAEGYRERSRDKEF